MNRDERLFMALWRVAFLAALVASFVVWVRGDTDSAIYLVLLAGVLAYASTPHD